MSVTLAVQANGLHVSSPSRVLSARLERGHLDTLVLLGYVILTVKVLLLLSVVLIPWTTAF